MNQGAERLREIFPDHGRQIRIAREVGVTQAAVSYWLAGSRRPNATSRGELERLYGIGYRLWDLDVEEAA